MVLMLDMITFTLFNPYTYLYLHAIYDHISPYCIPQILVHCLEVEASAARWKASLGRELNGGERNKEEGE